MKTQKLLIVLSCALLISGCKGKNKNEEPPHDVEPAVVEDLTPDQTVDVHIVPKVPGITDSSMYDVSLNYTDKYFNYTATTFKKDMMLVSFGMTMESDYKDKIIKFFTDLGYETQFINDGYDKPSEEHSVNYIISKKVVSGTNVYAVSVQGINYGKQWVDNLTAGEEGYHEGFYASATTVYNSLLNVIGDDSNFKIWNAGYSRGAAITNIVSSMLLKNQIISKDNLYTYTFATPRGLVKEDAIEYENVFNIVNSADIITHIAPEEFGMYRCGRDIEMYKENVKELFKSFTTEVPFPYFSISDNYKNDIEFTSYLMSQILKENDEEFDPAEYPYNLTSRAKYAEIQGYFTYFIGKMFSIYGSEEIFMNAFSKMSAMEIYGLFLDDGTKLYNKIKEIFDNNGYVYNEDELRETCGVFVLLASRYLPTMSECLGNKNVERMIYMHMPETIYVLINNI